MHDLNQYLPVYAFILGPLEFGEILQVVNDGGVDFVLVNPSIYTELADSRANAIATTKGATPTGSYSVYTGTIFCQAERQDIQALADLKGKTFMAVNS
ncbi:hypothetical protein DFAR_3770005 [Desulfarculales bacterium]